MSISLRRAYEKSRKNGEYRILVDRLWPRGVTKDALQIDYWDKDLAPSTYLRKWYNHDREKWDEFKRRYFEELDERPTAVAKLLDKAKQGDITLIFAAREPQYNNANALREYLIERLEKGH